MSLDITVPSPGESISEVQIATWLVEDGEFVEKDQDIVEIDSDKATLSIASPEDGQIKVIAQEGDTVNVGAVIASLDTSVKGQAKKATASVDEASPATKETKVIEEKAPAVQAEPAKAPKEEVNEEPLNISPLARKLLKENNLTEQDFSKFMKNYRVGKKDVEFFLAEKGNSNLATASSVGISSWGGTRDLERKKMSMLRLKLSERLVSVKNNTAMLTTFNEVNMTPIMSIRKKYKELFKEKHGTSLGFMSFFTKAVTEALNIVPGVNAMIDGNEIVYHNYADIGIAVSSPKGLMVPVIRNAEQLSLAEIESNIKTLAGKARSNKITIDEMTGGTFTITNGGVFGSMLSTPILNPPQSAILGMHNIVERPIAVNGKVEIHPIMYVALSYDHRIIDGSESVTFLVNVKQMLEDPAKMLFGGKDATAALLDL